MIFAYRPLVEYLTALAALGALLAAYQAVVVPWIEPPPQTSAVTPQNMPETRLHSTWADLFPEGSWQRDDPRQIATEAGVLLFRDWQQEASDRWRLSPVTLVLHHNAKQPNGEKPVPQRRVVLNAEGAMIRFAGSIELLGNEGTPPIAGGQLTGPVRITSPATRRDGQDRLEIDARNVVVDGRKIWTPEPVRLQLGRAEVAGRDLTIHLTKPGLASATAARGQLSGLDRLELIYLERLRLPLPEGGLWQSEAGPQQLPPIGPSAAPAEAWMDVRCGGALRFDFSTFTLRMHDHVELRHEMPRRPVDRIVCDDLAIRLYDPFSPPTNRPAWARLVRRVEARGEPVQLAAPTLSASGAAERVVIDLDERLVELTGEQPVTLQYRSATLTLPELSYRFAVDDPQRPGVLRVPGGGSLEASGSELPLRSISWKDSLWLYPDGDAHRLCLNGDATARLTDGGTFRADDLYFWFHWRGGAEAEKAADAGEPAEPMLRPDRLLAKGRVVADTPRLHAEHQQVELWFKPAASRPRPEESEEIALNQPRGEPLRLWVSQPEDQVQRKVPPARLEGRILRASVEVDAGRAVAGDLSVLGAVQLTHTVEGRRGAVPVQISGDELRLIENAESTDVQVAGRPARIDVGDGYLTGPLVQVRGGDNLIWIDRAGAIQFPKDLLATGDAATPAWNWLAPPRCTWQGQLTFDGQAVRVDGDVRVTGTAVGSGQPAVGRGQPAVGSGQPAVGSGQPAVWEVDLAAPQMELTLERRIDLRQSDSISGVAFQRLALKGGEGHQDVRLDARELTAGGEPHSVHQLRVPHLDFYPAEGRLRSSGVGSYRLWMAREKKSTGALGRAMGSAPLVAAHLVYRERLEGNLPNRTLEFQRAVRVAYSPVAHWEQTIDASRMGQPDTGQAVLDCDLLRITQTPGGSPQRSLDAIPWEIEASGGVAFRGKNEQGLFSSTAQRAAYAADKDLFVMEGDGTAPATLERTLATGHSGGIFRFHWFWFRPRDLQVVDCQIHSIGAGNLQQAYGIPRPEPPPARRNF